jgi:membrane protease YdiL (CAAX protease family)
MTYLDYAARGKNAGWRYAVGLCLAFALTALFWASLILALRLLRLLPPDLMEQMQHVRQPATFYLAQGVMFALLLAGFVAALAIVHGKGPGDIVGLWRWRGFGLGAATWLCALIVSSLIDLAIAPKGFSITADARTPTLAISALVGLSAQTFAEEFIFRGYVTQGLLLATRRPVLAAVLSGLVFGALHIPNGGPQAVNAVVFGVVLALIAIRTGGLAFGYGVHLINNIFGAVVVVSSGDVFRGSPGLFTQATSGLMWWDAAAGSAALLLLAALTLRRSDSSL